MAEVKTCKTCGGNVPFRSSRGLDVQPEYCSQGCRDEMVRIMAVATRHPSSVEAVWFLDRRDQLPPLAPKNGSRWDRARAGGSDAERNGK